jgi:hypothetical protein
MMRVLALIFVFVFIGCGDGEERVVPSEVQKTYAPLYVGESRTISFLMDSEKNYLVQLENSNEFNRNVDVSLSYFATTRPKIKFTGTHAGEETIYVSIEDEQGNIQKAEIYAYVYRNPTPRDEVGTTPIKDVPIGGDDNISDGNDDGGIITPPAITGDPEACNDVHSFWSHITDDWSSGPGSPENAVGSFTYSIHSLIPLTNELGEVTLYYRNDVPDISREKMALGIFEQRIDASRVVKFDVGIPKEYATYERPDGKPNVIYVKAHGTCFQVKVPTSPELPAEKLLTPARQF